MVFVHVLNAFEKPFVQPHVVGVLGENGAHLLCQRIEFVVGFCAEHARKNIRHAVKQVVIVVSVLVVHPDNGVFEGGRFGVVYKFLNLFVVSPDTFQECLFVVFGSYQVERHGFVRCFIFPEKGVVVIFAFFFQILIHNCKCLLVSLLSPFSCCRGVGLQLWGMPTCCCAVRLRQPKC